MWRDLQIDHQTIAHVAASALQPVLVIAVALQIVAPRLAPERRGDLAAFHGHRRQERAFLAQLPRRTLSLEAPFGDRDVGRPLTFVVPSHGVHSLIAAFRSSATSRMMSSFPISVRLTSAPPVSSSSDNPCFESIKASIFSSTVPRQINL